MDPERWRRIQELFSEASGQAADEREAWLDERCGDDHELRREVASLLAASDGSESFVEGVVRGGYELLDATPSRFGKYEVLEKIGQGGFGTVYKGRDPLLQRTVAIKTCTTDDADLRARFFREGRIAARLQHPNVTTIHDFGVAGGVPYLVQEFLSGRDLSDVTGLPVAERLAVLAQVARGLEYAHGQGVLHRDVKPANVRVLDDGTAKIMDFGIARLLSGADTRLTGTGMMMGTVGYLAPEQLKGDDVDERADLFSFGVLAYELCAGTRPFPGETFSEVSYRLLYETPRPLAEAWPDCPDPRLAEIVGRCLEKEVTERHATMGDVAAALEAVLATLPDDATGAATLAMPGALPAELEVPDSRELTRLEPRPEATATEAPPRRTWPRWAVPAMVVAVLLGVLWSRRPEMPVSAPTTLAPVVVPEDSTATAMATEAEPEAPPVKGPAVEAAPADGIPIPDENVPPPAPVPPPPPPPPTSASPPPASTSPPPPTSPPTTSPPTVEEPVLETSAGPSTAAEVVPPPPPPAPPVTEETPVAEPPATPPMRTGDHIQGTEPNVVPPAIVAGAQPVYPRRARLQGREARVVVAVLVDENGEVLQVLIRHSDDAGFNEAAEAAARRTRFRPATRDGVPGRMWTEIPYDFRLER